MGWGYAVWQGVAMDSLKFHPGPSTPCGQATSETPYGCFKGGPSAGQAASDHLLLLWTPHAIRLWAAVEH
jgi:hypothetical protein